MGGTDNEKRESVVSIGSTVAYSSTDDTCLINFEQNGDRREKSLSDSFVVAKCRSKADPEGGETETDSKLCGWLVKYSSIGFVKTSKLHWFIFGDDTCKLYYYRQPQDLLPLGEIDIKHATLFFDASNREKPGSFEIRYCI